MIIRLIYLLLLSITCLTARSENLQEALSWRFSNSFHPDSIAFKQNHELFIFGEGVVYSLDISNKKFVELNLSGSKKWASSSLNSFCKLGSNLLGIGTPVDGVSSWFVFSLSLSNKMITDLKSSNLPPTHTLCNEIRYDVFWGELESQSSYFLSKTGVLASESKPRVADCKVIWTGSLDDQLCYKPGSDEGHWAFYDRDNLFLFSTNKFGDACREHFSITPDGKMATIVCSRELDGRKKIHSIVIMVNTAAVVKEITYEENSEPYDIVVSDDKQILATLVVKNLVSDPNTELRKEKWLQIFSLL